MQQLLSFFLFSALCAPAAQAQPLYFQIKKDLEESLESFQSKLENLGIQTDDNQQIFVLDQYNGAYRATGEIVESLGRYRSLLGQYPKGVPRTQKEMNKTLNLLIFYVNSADFLKLVFSNKALSTILNEYSTHQDSRFIQDLISKTKFHLKRSRQNKGQRLYKTIDFASHWPIASVPDWLGSYLDRAQDLSSNPYALNDRYFLDYPLMDFFYALKSGILYQTGLVSLPKNYFITHRQVNTVQEQLLPGDIATIKHYYKLTNLAFSGEWSHGLIYLGSWNKMKKYFDSDSATKHFFKSMCSQNGWTCKNFSGFLEKKLPEVVAYYKNNLSDYRGQKLPRVVLESKGEGVILSNIYDGLMKDQLAVFRPKMSLKAKAIAIYTSLQYVFRPYDYDFNFQSQNRLVCTQIIFNSFSPGVHSSLPDFQWEQSYILGRPVVQATDIVKTFARDYEQGSEKFDFVFFLKGNKETSSAHFSTPSQLIQTIK